MVMEGYHNFEIQVWWEIQPRFVDARRERSLEKAGRPKVEDEVGTCIEERVRTSKACCPQVDSLTDRVKQGMVERQIVLLCRRPWFKCQCESGTQEWSGFWT